MSYAHNHPPKSALSSSYKILKENSSVFHLFILSLIVHHYFVHSRLHNGYLPLADVYSSPPFTTLILLSTFFILHFSQPIWCSVNRLLQDKNISKRFAKAIMQYTTPTLQSRRSQSDFIYPQIQRANSSLESVNLGLQHANMGLQCTNDRIKSANAGLQSIKMGLQLVNAGLQSVHSSLQSAKLGLQYATTSLQCLNVRFFTIFTHCKTTKTNKSHQSPQSNKSWFRHAPLPIYLFTKFLINF